MFIQPNIRTMLYWLDELINSDENRVFEVEDGAPVPVSLQINSPTQRTLTAASWTIPCEFDRLDRVSLTPRFESVDDPLADPIRSILRCLGMPPARNIDQTLFGLACLQKAIVLHDSFVQDAAERDVVLNETDIADFLVEMEVLVIEHGNACTRVCDTGEGEEQVSLVENRLLKLVQSRCDALGISPVTLAFNRDPRGATVTVGFAKDAVDQQSTVSAHHRSLDVRMCKNALREAAMAAMHSHLEEPASSRPTKVLKNAPAKKGPAGAVVVASDISPDLLVILRDGAWSNGNVFKIPDTQLDRKLYERVAEAIKLAGGKWSVSKQGFVFKDGPEKFATLLTTGQAIDRKQYDFFWTPTDLARNVVVEADIQPGMMVLEPEAGTGAIADQAAAIVGKENVICYELLAENVAKLREKGYTVIEGDFLAIKPNPIFDRIVMNPPFGNQSDMRHIEHAARFLKPDGKLVAIMGTGFQTRESKQSESFNALLKVAGNVVKEIEAGAFKDSGTNVSTVMVSLYGDLMPWNQVEKEVEVEAEADNDGRPFFELSRG